MTLEDFFTLTEMKDGLTALARVEELVSVMQKDRDSVVKNISEATRQWSTVANTLAATENQGILDHFILLDGIYFLDQWLQEAQKSSNDTSDSSVLGSIGALLGALEKLPIDNERSVSSGIGVTVKNLCGHKSFGVQERARALLNSWNQGKHNVADHQDIVKDSGCHYDRVKSADATVAVESGCLEHPADDITPVNGSADGDNLVVKPVESECQHSRSSHGSQSESIKDLKVPISNAQGNYHTTLSKEDGYRENAQGLSSMSPPCQESLSPMDESPLRPMERMTSMGICTSPVPLEGNVDGSFSDVPELKDFPDDVKGTDMMKESQDKFDEKEICAVSTSSGPELVPSADPANVQRHMLPPVLNNIDARESAFCLKKTPPTGLDDDASTPDSEPKSMVVDCGVPKHSSAEELETSFTSKEDVKEHSGESIFKVEGGKDYATSDFSEPMMDNKVSEIDKSRSDMELEYGVVDALEIARQVAKEVEREVVDYRKHFCNSSSEKISGGVVQPGSPDSINGEQDQPVTGPQNEMPRRQNLPIAPPSPNGEDHFISSLNSDPPEDCMHDMNSSQITEVVKEPAFKTKKGLYVFDLNEEFCSEEMDHPRTPRSVPVTVVSASKAAVPRFSAAPLHFGGELGWKGSAATSAFRPASPRRTPDGEKTHSVEGSNQSSKQRQDFLCIDLNVAEGNDDGVTNPIPGKQIPVSSGLPSGESSIEVSSRRAERLMFDLNRAGDNEEAPSSDYRMEGRSHYPHQNGSPSPASSSCSRQPSMRNINLNDSPSYFDDSNDQQPGLGQYSSIDLNACGGFKLDDPIISIMGTRVEVDRKEFVPQTQSFLPNGQIIESPIGANSARSVGAVGMQPVMAYATPPPSVFGYNSLSTGSMSFSPAMYGSGSVHVVPQMMGSPAPVPPSYSYSQSQFLMSMTGPLRGLNQVVTARPTLDLNTGLAVVEAENREPRGLRQLFIPGQGVLMEEQMRSTSQLLNSGMGAKRKEPDGGLDVYPFSYRHQSPWH